VGVGMAVGVIMRMVVLSATGVGMTVRAMRSMLVGVRPPVTIGLHAHGCRCSRRNRIIHLQTALSVVIGAARKTSRTPIQPASTAASTPMTIPAGKPIQYGW
jgi:hypothetical protein